MQISAAGNFELEILEISNTNSHLLTGYCCGVPLEIRSTKTLGKSLIKNRPKIFRLKIKFLNFYIIFSKGSSEFIQIVRTEEGKKDLS